MAREVRDEQGITWNCIEAYAGLSDAGSEAARAEGPDERYRVVCTPSGGSRSVELELPAGWEESMSDDDLVREISQRSTAE